MRRTAVRPSVLSLVSSALLVLAPPAGAGEGGTLTGSVRSDSGTPLPHLVLTISGPGGTRSVVTGPGGRFRAEGLALGEHSITTGAPGFVLSPESRPVVAEGVSRVDLTLSPAPIREQVLVSATRGHAALSTLGMSATVLDRERLAARESSDFLHLLQEVPGVSVARAGGVGLQAAAFVRGGESRFARILVDGVPVNEPGGFQNFGSQLPLELESVEVVRGAASSLYGTDALAGVVQVLTRRAGADDGVGVHGEAEGGSFGWRRLRGGSSGRSGVLDWNAGLQHVQTDNEEPNSAFDQQAAAASLGARLGDRTDLRLVLRAERSEAGTPGQTALGRPDLDASYERNDLVASGLLRHLRDRVAHELRVGFARAEQLSLNPEDSGSFTPRYGELEGSFPVSDFTNPEGLQNDTRRQSAGYQAEIQVGGVNLLTLGADLERETGELGDRRGELLSPERTNFGAYVQDRVVLGKRVFLTLGARVERNHSYGTEVVPRAAVAWRLGRGGSTTTLRGSAGAGIKEPSFFESFGISPFARGNPNLKPERSRTFDAGIEQRLLGDRLRAEATLFHHDYHDQIAYTVTDFTTFEGSYINLGQTRARGLELSLEAAPAEGLRLSAGYTLLDGTILTSSSAFDPVLAEGRSLIRRPKHQGSVSVRVGNERVDAGAHLFVVGRRADSDFLGLGITESDGYARLDARLRVQLSEALEAFVAGENVLDAQYQEVLGYPALGRSVRVGLRFRSDGKTGK
jgi:vitamin B12 transporter